MDSKSSDELGKIENLAEYLNSSEQKIKELKATENKGSPDGNKIIAKINQIVNQNKTVYNPSDWSAKKHKELITHLLYESCLKPFIKSTKYCYYEKVPIKNFVNN